MLTFFRLPARWAFIRFSVVEVESSIQHSTAFEKLPVITTSKSTTTKFLAVGRNGEKKTRKKTAARSHRVKSCITVETMVWVRAPSVAPFRRQLHITGSMGCKTDNGSFIGRSRQRCQLTAARQTSIQTDNRRRRSGRRRRRIHWATVKPTTTDRDPTPSRRGETVCDNLRLRWDSDKLLTTVVRGRNLLTCDRRTKQRDIEIDITLTRCDGHRLNHSTTT